MTNRQPFHPPELTLMGPGPSDVSPRVLGALARPTIGHLDPHFIALMDDIKGLLQSLLMTRNTLTLPVSAPGSAGMECVLANLIEPGNKVVVCQNGVFGGRIAENVRRMGGEVVLIEDVWGEAVSLDKVARALGANPDAVALAFVHAETSTGACSDAQALCRLAKQHDCLSIVDAVTSVGGIPVDVDGWGIDALYTGSQKCLSCVPGLSPVTFSPAAQDRILKRRLPVQSWFLDMSLVMAYWEGDGGRTYHHTAPVNSLYALHEALLMLDEEGLSAAWQRHARHHRAFVAGVEAMGLEMLVAPEARLPQLNTVLVPEGVDEAAVRKRLLQDYLLEIGAGLGPLAGRVWRIGLMGHACRRSNVLNCLGALAQSLVAEGASVDTDAAVKAALAFYQRES